MGGLILSFELGDVPPGPLMVGLLCITFGLVTVGPTAKAMRLLGDKIASKRLAEQFPESGLAGSDNDG